MNKILIFSPFALEFGRGGEISTIELVSGLNKHFEIKLIHTNIRYQEKSLSPNTILGKLGNIENLIRLRYATYKISDKVFTFPYPQDIITLFGEIKRSDIVYFSISTIKNSLLFIISSLFFRSKKYIVGYRKPLNIKKRFSIYNLKYRTNILILSLFRKRFFHHTLSKHAKNYLEKFYEPKKVFHITHGIDLERYKQIDVKKKSDTLNFIYIGYLDDEHKGVGVLLKGIRQFLSRKNISNVHFEICGKGPLFLEVKTLESEFPNFITFHGYVDNDNIFRFYAENDIFLFTSRREPFPRTIMEALAGGCIILCTKTIGSIELLKSKDFSFFLKRLNKNEISNSIAEILRIWKEQPQKIEKLQKEAKIFVEENYSFKFELEGFHRLIHKILY
jgi:glycosyltransferase involved in cell wall biosynthesis